MSHISLIRLNNFRNLVNQEIGLYNSANIFIGPNGSGKTNIIESLSLLSPGKGLKKQMLSQISKFKSNDPWVIFFKYKQKNNTEINLAVTYERSKKGSNLKKILINGVKQKKSDELNYTPPIIWFVPEMERLFVATPSVRRDFIDRIVYSFDKTILFQISSYMKLLKERYNILLNNNFDINWLEDIEEKISLLGIQITEKRHKTIKIINNIFDKDLSKIGINGCDIKPIGYIDSSFSEYSRDQCHQKYINELKRSREEDLIKGGCKIGPHKSDFEVIYLKNKVNSSLCSTGQQKEIILNILLCQAYCLIKIFNKAPIVLLDEICSHLDDNTRRILLHLIEWLELQVLMTGTDKKLFSFLAKKAKFFYVNNGIIKPNKK